MKKMLTVVLTATMLMCLISCGEPGTNPDKQNIHTAADYDIMFWTDEETGVQYVIYDARSGDAGQGGITPRLNPDGSVYVVD